MDSTTFLDTIFGELPEGEMILVSYPGRKGHAQFKYAPGVLEKPQSWYFCVSSVLDQKPARRRGEDCQAIYLVVLDDIGGKYPEPPIEPSYKLESSAGNFQWGYLLELPADTDATMAAVEAAWRGLCDAGYSDQIATRTRVMRLPGSVHKSGFVARIVDWHPERTFTVEQLLQGMAASPRAKGSQLAGIEGDDPLVPWLVSNLGARPGNPMTVPCPWAAQHTDGRPESAYWPIGSNGRLSRGWHCMHSHCEGRTTDHFLAAIAEAGGPRYTTTGVAPIPKSWRDALPKVTQDDLPNLQLTAKGAVSATQQATTVNIEAVMRKLGISCRYNMQTKRVELTAPWHWSVDMVRAELQSACMMIGIGAMSMIDQQIGAIAKANCYHPLGDAIRATVWDQRDRWAEIMQTIHLARGQDPELLGTLLRRWFLQAVRGWTLQSDETAQLGGVLVFVGPQFRGKSKWFKRLAAGARDGVIAPHVKDTLLQALAAPIFEMSELEGTFRKSDIAALKAFITQETDVIRAPYAPKADEWPRQTVFGASVNDTSFLVDPTGNRRFWCLEVERLEHEHQVDIMQLYAQAWAELQGGEQWWLTDAEHQLQMKAAEDFLVPCTVADSFEVFFEKKLDRPVETWCAINCTQLATLLALPRMDQRELSRLKNLITLRFGKMRQFGASRRKGWKVPVTRQELEAHAMRPIDD
jgi:putative DNA primase/helicase